MSPGSGVSLPYAHNFLNSPHQLFLGVWAHPHLVVCEEAQSLVFWEGQTAWGVFN